MAVLTSFLETKAVDMVQRKGGRLSKIKNKYTNRTAHYRRRWHLTQKQVLRLMGEEERSRLWDLEAGRSLPSLKTAFKLSAIFRVPVEFLYPDLYIGLRETIRKREVGMPHGQQGILPLFGP
jgi:DNA-binding XRE family transcriptional regulator